MPSIHIAEETFRSLVEQEGGYQAAKDKVKDAAKDAVESEHE